MRAAVYTGTRNIYQNMITAAKSLLEHSNVEKIYFLIEDDVFPYELPSDIECINVSNQQYFPHNGPNYNSPWTYMILIRVALSKIFPTLDTILLLDMDTIVNENVSSLWDINLDGYYFAAVREPLKSRDNFISINAGVMLINLKQLREDKKDDELIKALNTYYYKFPEQDCISDLCQGHLLVLPSDYNVCSQNDKPEREKITHFAAIYRLDIFPHFQYYQQLSWDKLQRNKSDNITLDIIIPTYKNKKELQRTLYNIPQHKDINVIVIDDCSEMDYTDIKEEYPFITFYQLDSNQGPGMARQYGIEHSNGTYITFLDAGDYFYPNGVQTILNEIQKNTYIKIYSFSYVHDDKNILCDKPDDKTIGAVYKRSFIEMYDIHFCKEGSYADEDYGFSRACKIIAKYLEEKWHFYPLSKHIYMPTFYEHIDSHSLTKSKVNDFFFTKLSPGIIINGLHAIQIAQKAHVDIPFIVNELSYIMAQQYFFFLCVVHERPELADTEWDIIRDFYYNHYRTYNKVSHAALKEHLYTAALPRINARMKNWTKNIPLNIDKFVQELETEQFVPLRYLT